MPKCLECGFEAPRLQWTHFKFNCTGRFNNGKEYKQVYPTATLVDNELAKKTAITQSNLIKKYGKEIGTQKWREYKSKQSYSNSYEYKKEKYGWTEIDFDNFNKSRAITLDNLVKKYGISAGSEKWISYCERQAYTNTLNYFIEKFGNELGTKKYQEICKAKSHSLESIMVRYNCSKEDAKDIRNSFNNQGYSSLLEKEIIEKIEQNLGSKLDYTYNTKQYCIWSDTGPKFYDIVHNKKAIEIHGDYWHTNPLIYPPNYYHSLIELLAEDIWKKDLEKKQLIETSRNIPLLTVWESEYLNDPETIIKRCVEWLN